MILTFLHLCGGVSGTRKAQRSRNETSIIGYNKQIRFPESLKESADIYNQEAFFVFPLNAKAVSNKAILVK